MRENDAVTMTDCGLRCWKQQEKRVCTKRHAWSLLESILIAIAIAVDVIVDIVHGEEIATADPLTSLPAVGETHADPSCQRNCSLFHNLHDLRRGGTNRLHDRPLAIVTLVPDRFATVKSPEEIRSNHLASCDLTGDT